jgi:hypothetical protein
MAFMLRQPDEQRSNAHPERGEAEFLHTGWLIRAPGRAR